MRSRKLHVFSKTWMDPQPPAPAQHLRPFLCMVLTNGEVAKVSAVGYDDGRACVVGQTMRRFMQRVVGARV